MATFRIKNMPEYHDHYLFSDVLLLADVFSNIRNSVMAQHRLDCLHYAAVARMGIGFEIGLHGYQARLLANLDVHLMIENNMRGGIATVSNRRASANNPYVEGYDETKPTTFITHLDANSLHGGTMNEPLPIRSFHFLLQPEIDTFDLSSIPPATAI